jgi:diacylglycerol kinase family enzyme
VVNPTATSASRRTREVLAAALDSDLKVEVAYTGHRGHARELADQARTDGLDVVVAHGGDGTVNEVVNGLLADGPHPDLPDLAVVPGGGTNVFARALGLPADPVEATGALLDAVRTGRRRRIGLGRADDRWFTFCAGLGLDARVVAAVDRRRSPGAPPRAGDYVRAGLGEFFLRTDRRRPALTLARPGAPAEPVHLAIVSNTTPWTYLGARPLHTSPAASFDSGLDVYGLRRLRTAPSLRQLRQMVVPGPGPRGRQVVSLHDLAEVTVRSERPAPLQVDGEPLPDRTEVTFRSTPGALRVLA